jgi:hypothetical protein
MKAKKRNPLNTTVKPKAGPSTQLALIDRTLGGANIEIYRDPTPVDILELRCWIPKVGNCINGV